MLRYIAYLLIVCSLPVFGQSEIKTTQGFLFSPHVAFHTPGNDLAKRFNNFAAIGLGADYKFSSNFILGLDYDWYFGRSVIDNGLFSGIAGTSGQIIDKNGDFSVIQLHIKGNNATAHLGYLLNVPRDQPNSGILVTAGAGFIQHRIDIISSQVTIPQLNNAYEYGYDKLTYGLNLRQFIGYQYLVDHNRYHFKVGVEFNQGFTRGRRTWDFNDNAPGTAKRFDTSMAFKFGIIVPVYTKGVNDEEFFID